MSLSDITFLGVGNMGHALVQALLRSGHSVKIWNRTKGRPLVESAIALGAIFEDSLEQALATANLIIICVTDYEKINAIVSQAPSGTFKNKTLLNFTNGTPRQAREMASWASSQGISMYFDGAIMVTPQMVGGPYSTLVISGESDEKYDAVSAVLSPLGKASYLGTDVAAAARFDCAALITMYGMFNGAFLGMALLKQGQRENKIGSVVSNAVVPMLNGITPLLGRIAKAWDEETFGDHKGNPMGMQVEALSCIKQACEEDGIDFGSMGYFTNLMEQVVKDFGENSDVAALGTYLLKSAE